MAMPRLLKVTICNLFNHEKTVLDLTNGHIYNLIGDEGEGKSAILKALDLALNGRCELDRVDGDKLTLDELWDAVGKRDRQPTEQPSVILEVRGSEGKKGTLTRTRRTASLRIEDGTTITTKEGMAKFFGVRDLGVLAVAFRSQHVMAMKPTDRVRLLFDALGQPLTIADLAKEGVDDEEVQRAAINRSVSSGRDVATSKRRDISRSIKELELITPASDPTFETPKGLVKVSTVPQAEIEKLVADLEKKRLDTQQAIGAAEGAARGSSYGPLASEAAKDLQKAKATHAKEEEALKVLLGSEEAELAKQAEGRKKELLGEFRKMQAELADLEGRIRTSTETRDRLHVRLQELGTVQGPDMKCPWCASSTRVETVIERLSADSKAEEAISEKLLAEHGQLLARKGEVEKEGRAKTSALEGWQKKVDAAKLKEANARSAMAEAERYSAKVGEQARAAKQAAEAAGTGDLVKLREEDATLAQRLENARRLLLAVQQYRTVREGYEKAQARVKELRAVEARYEAMEKALGPDGFIVQRLKEPITLLRAKVEEIAGKVFRVPHTIEVLDDMAFRMNGAPAEAGSRGEKYTTGAVLAAAFSSLAGLGLLVLDDMNLLGAQARDRFMGFVLEVSKAAQIEQVFLACTRQRDGWCDACGCLTVSGAKGTCLIPRGGKPCGTRVVPSRPRGAMVGVLRTFDVVGGGVTEVLPLGAVQS